MSTEPITRNEKRETGFTRRALAGLLSTSAVLLAQAPAPLPSNPDEELKAATDTIQKNSEQLAKVDLPMSTEPAVHFRA